MHSENHFVFFPGVCFFLKTILFTLFTPAPSKWCLSTQIVHSENHFVFSSKPFWKVFVFLKTILFTMFTPAPSKVFFFFNLLRLCTQKSMLSFFQNNFGRCLFFSQNHFVHICSLRKKKKKQKHFFFLICHLPSPRAVGDIGGAIPGELCPGRGPEEAAFKMRFFWGIENVSKKREKGWNMKLPGSRTPQV